MNSVRTHYETLLANLYTWLMGGFGQASENNMRFFTARGFSPGANGRAVDLGAGSGFQSVPLAQLGYAVTAIDLSSTLLQELELHRNNLDISIVNDDILALEKHIQAPCELVVCMTDTLTHLPTKANVRQLLKDVYECLSEQGKFVISFRDLSEPLEDTDRFIPMRSDENTIFTCFLEYETDTVNVNDIVYLRDNGEWKLHKSSYKKLRLSLQWLTDMLVNTGFSVDESSEQDGFNVLVVSKPS